METWVGGNEYSGINKQKVHAAFLTKRGFLDDDVADQKHHGGLDRAVCIYPFEHYKMWAEEFHKDFQPPTFGENLSISGMLEKDVYIGDIYRIGDAVVQVTQGRIPCAKISNHNSVNALLGRIVETGFSGYFFRVIEEGEITEDSDIKLVDRTQNQFSVLNVNQTLFHDRKNRKVIEQIVNIKELAEKFRVSLEKCL